MENHRIFKLEFYNLIFKENAITYHETDQKSWFLLREGYMFSSLWCGWGYLKKCCENRGHLNKKEKIPMVTSNFWTISLLHTKYSSTKRIHPFSHSEITEYKSKCCKNQRHLRIPVCSNFFFHSELF